MKAEKTCSLFIRHKNRQCRLLAVTGTEFCVHHLSKEDREKVNRVPCPFNDNHTVASSGLRKHLFVCPNRPELMNQAPRINSVADSTLLSKSPCLPPIQSIPGEVFRFIEKLKTIDHTFSLNRGLLDEQVEEHEFAPVIGIALQNPRHWSVNGFPGLLLSGPSDLSTSHERPAYTDLNERGRIINHSKDVPIPNSHGAKRHIYQNGCLLNILKAAQLMSSAFAYVEFGAGRGGLSHWLNLCLASERYENQAALEKEVAWIAKPVDTVFILVEFKCTRNKFDIRHRDAGNFIRVHMDIAQLKLDDVPALKSRRKPIVAVAKHLCGDATDLALRCLKNAMKTTDCECRVSGLMFAVCCHHQCSWQETVGRPWLEREVGLTAREFAIATRLSSWATCGFTFRQTGDSHSQSGNFDHSSDQPPKTSPFASISPQERTLIGRTCKRLIDWGRMRFIQNELNFSNVRLLPYTSTEVTAENVVLVAGGNRIN